MKFQQDKLRLVVLLMSVGMLLAVAWHVWQAYILGRPYPYSTFLFSPIGRFRDFSETLFTANLPNPYDNPVILYLPFTWIVFHAIFPTPGPEDIIAFFFVCLSLLALLLVRILGPVVANPWKRTLYTYLLIGTAYPVIFAVDRGNIELLLALLVGCSLFCFAQNKYLPGMLFLLPAISFKLYPAFLLVMLLRQRRVALIVLCLGAVVVLNYLSFMALDLPLQKAWGFYQRNGILFTETYVYQNFSLEGSASPWNAFKIGLLIAGKLHLIAPVDFSYDGKFVQIAYAFYSLGLVGIALFLGGYVCFIEKEFNRCVAVLLLFLAICTASGGDYRLLYAGLALIALILIRTKRKHDLLSLILITLVMIPKKVIFLTFLGKTESSYRDVPLDVLLHPLFILTAMGLLLYDGCREGEIQWIRLRILRMWRALGPGRLFKSHASR